MTVPTYYIENRYAFINNLSQVLALPDYTAHTPESEFERSVYVDLAHANDYLYRQEYRLALHAYQQLSYRILNTAHPTLPPSPGTAVVLGPKVVAALVDPLIDLAAKILNVTRRPIPELPTSLKGVDPLPPLVQKKLDELKGASAGPAWLPGVDLAVDRARALGEQGRWADARVEFENTLKTVPAKESLVRASLEHDLAIASDKAGDRAAAIKAASASATLFGKCARHDDQHAALVMLADIQQRAGKVTARKKTLEGISTLAERFKLASGPAVAPGSAPTVQPRVVATTHAPGAARDAKTTMLLGKEYFSGAESGKALALFGDAGGPQRIALGTKASANLKSFYKERIASADLALATGQLASYTQLVAYIPHIYFFVLPMAIGDCYLAIGAFESARDQYLSVLQYPYINRKAEVPKLWMRLADLMLAWGDDLYQQARDTSAGWTAAAAKYALIVRLDETVPANSPLYSHATLKPMQTRVAKIAAAANRLTLDENPAIISRVVQALNRLRQIDAGLNYFGLAPDYIPPFTFEYLYNLAHHFGTEAKQAEQRYIQFKAQAEDEEYRREQLAQQVELADATIKLEKLNVAEAQAGIDAAQATLHYANVQKSNANQAQAAFAAVRWELAELEELSAWAGAAAQAQDDEVKLTISGYTYYNTSDRRRSLVVQDLARKRVRISHDLEAGRLAREVASATAYVGVAQAQKAQAEARKRVAEERVQVAELQQRQATENVQFMDLKEFGERLWYELARDARRHMRHYLDMATEVAFMMERAYDAETDRGLRVIKFHYGVRSRNDLMGAEALLSDVDYFMLDYARTQSKKAPIKESLSIADQFPMAFDQFKRTGTCFFETTLEQFDRNYPGYYLRKIRDVEIVFVGLTAAPGIHGTLRNVGISKFRRQSGAIEELHYPADVMPLSDYDVRRDALVFRVDSKKLRLFENNAPATQWQLSLPLDSNDLDYSQLLDVHLVVEYDAFFDSSLEATVKAALPKSSSVSRAVSMRLEYPDELFYLRNQGACVVELTPAMFPYNQMNQIRTEVAVRAAGAAGPNLTLRIKSNAVASPMTVKLDADGLAQSTAQPLKKLNGESLFDRWEISIEAADNAGLVHDGSLDLSGLDDLTFFLDYDFDYRG